MVRIFFFFIQVILMLIFEKKLHFFQYKILLVGMINTFMILMASQMNPVVSMRVYWSVVSPYFKRKTTELQPKIDKAFEDDVAFEYYNPFRKQQRERAQGQGGDLSESTSAT